MDPDLEVVEAVLQGDTNRYGELVSRYQLAAWKLAYSLVGNMEEAKDLSQNGFVKAYRHLRGFRRGSKFSTWLYRIIANECKDFLRQKGRQPPFISISTNAEADDSSIFDPPDTAKNPRDVAHNRELAKRLARAIGRLPMKQQMAFVLHHLNGLPLQEVAQVMGCRLGTVKAHLFRAAESLRFSIGTLLTEEVRR